MIIRKKHRIFASLAVWALWLGWALTIQAAPQITFEQTSFEYGDAQANSTITHTFTFKNTGDEALIIESLHSP